MPKDRSCTYWWKDKKECLRWFDHAQMRVINVSMKKCEMIQVEGMKKYSGIPKITLIKVFKNEITESMNLDTIKWKKQIHITDPK